MSSVDSAIRESGYVNPQHLKFLTSATNLGTVLKAHPFHWNAKTQKLEYGDDKTTQILYHIGVVYSLCYELFAVVRSITILASVDGEKSTEKVLLSIFSSLYLASPALLQVAVWKGGYQFVDLVNNALQLQQEFSRHTPPEKTKEAVSDVRMVNTALTVTFYSTKGSGILLTLLCLVNPGFSLFVTSVIEDKELLQSLSVRIAGTVLIAYEMYLYVAVVDFVIFIGFVIPFPVQRMIDSLSHTSSRGEEHWNLLRYKQISILMNKFSKLYSPIILPGSELTGIGFSIYGFVSLILFKGLLGITLAFVGVNTYVIIVVVFKYLAGFHSKSVKLLQEWKRHQVVNARILRSLKPVEVKLGSFAYVDAGIIFTINDIVMNNAISLLLMK